MKILDSFLGINQGNNTISKNSINIHANNNIKIVNYITPKYLEYINKYPNDPFNGRLNPEEI